MPTAGHKTRYERKRTRAGDRERAVAAAGRDIGELPRVRNPRRRAAAGRSLRVFCETYLAARFPLAWSPDHLKVIDKMETAVRRGGLFAVAMPRGSGKTTLSEAAAIWGLLYGYRRFVVLVGSDKGSALEMLDAIRGELESNDDLCDDFPAVCVPIRALDGIAHRCKGQLCGGTRTRIAWEADRLRLPTIGREKSNGAIVRVAGITGRIRGMKSQTAAGEAIRPDLVILDDPQTDESARSLSQCAYREAVITGAVLGLAGPGRKISGVMPCTVIRRGDLADRILNPKLFPEWNGERCKMVYAFPTNESLWSQYADIRGEELRAGRGIDAATEFYRANRAAMDDGAAVAWPARFDPDELSAVQNAMNLRLRDESAFWAEYQNEPLDDTRDAEFLTAEQIVERVGAYARGVVPDDATRLTAFVDVQDKALYYLVAAWAPDFTGWIIDYGTFPKQTASYFALAQIRRTLAREFPRAGLEGRIFQGLTKLVGSWSYARADGSPLPLDRVLVDANWGRSTNVVYQFTREHPAGLVLPTHGRFIGATSTPITAAKRQTGEIVGLNWRVRWSTAGRKTRYGIYDVNFWKSFVCSRLAATPGDRGSLVLFKPAKAGDHRLFADHLVAEYRTRVEANDRVVDEWKLRPERPDNHLFDCLVGAAVAASMQGVALSPKPLPSDGQVDAASRHSAETAAATSTAAISGKPPATKRRSRVTYL